MGPMVRGRPIDRKRVTRWSALTLLALFLWSFVAAPSAQTEEAAIPEPDLAAYDANADATPLAALLDHQVTLITLPPTLAHSSSEVSLPSQGSSTAYLLDNGLLNGLHGTTTGNKVPTEVTASQPGGNEKDEFILAETPIGNDSTARVGAGVARATAEHSTRPRGYSHAYLGNLVLLPAPGSPEQAPGTYDPANDREREHEDPTTFPVASGSPKPSPGADDPRAYTPNTSGQMGILTVGSVASTSDSFREGGKVVSIAVAEINGINIGNRTGDNRCTNCITIDSIRIEARAESDGTAAGALAAWRLLIHRACRVSIANDGAGNAYESVRCLDPNPDKVIEVLSEPEHRNQRDFEDAFADENANGWGYGSDPAYTKRVGSIDELNAMFERGLGSGDMATGDLGLRLFFNTQGVSKVTDAGQAALAEAAGLQLQVTTAVQTRALGMFESAARAVSKPEELCVNTTCQQLPDVAPTLPPEPTPTPKPSPVSSFESKVRPSPTPSTGGQAIDYADGQCQVHQDVEGRNRQVAVPCVNGTIDKGKLLRTVSLTFGRVSVAAVARPGIVSGGGGGGGPTGPQFPTINIPTVNIPSFDIPSGGGGGGNTYVVGGGVGAGPLKVKINWSSVRLKLWSKQDQAKAWFTALLGASLVGLIRRRLHARL